MKDLCGIVIVFIAFLVVFGVKTLAESHHPYSHHKPIFSVGDCLVSVDDPDAESWEQKANDRQDQILEVGKHAYRTRSHYSWDKTGTLTESTLNFSWEQFHKKVKCDPVFGSDLK